MKEITVPQGFAAALAQNPDAANTYAMMTRAEKQEILSKAQKIQSDAQLTQLVHSLAAGQHLQ